MLKNFSSSAKNLKNTRVLCTAAIMTALFVVLYSIKLPLAPELRITFTFIPLALTGWLLGPVPAMLTGLCGDLIGCAVFPQGAYFPGFTVTKILTGLLFGLFLYKRNAKKILIPAFLSVFLIDMLLNVLLNALWLSMMYGKAWGVYAASHFVKNVFALPVEVIILVLLIKLLSVRHIEKMYK